MNYLKKITNYLILTFILILCPIKTIAADINYDPKTTSDLKKQWTIVFTDEVDFNTANNNTIKIYDEKSVPIEIKIEEGNSPKECIISSTAPYKNKHIYYLYISNEVKSIKGKALKNGVYMDFTVDTSYKETYTASAKVELGLLPSFKQITINSTTIPNAKRYRIEEKEDIIDLSETTRALIDAPTTIVYFYSEDDVLLGAGMLDVSKANNDLTFQIK